MSDTETDSRQDAALSADRSSKTLSDLDSDMWDIDLPGADHLDQNLGADNVLGADLGCAEHDLDQINDNIQDYLEDNLSLEVNFGDGSSCRVSDDKDPAGPPSPPAAGSGRSRSSSREKETGPQKELDPVDFLSEPSDTTPTASEIVPCSGTNGTQSDVSMEGVSSSSGAQKRNSLEIRNNIPDTSEVKNYERDVVEDKNKLQSVGAVPKIRKKSPGLARRLADSMQIEGSRESSSSERETEPAVIDTTVRSAQLDFELRNSAIGQFKTSTLPSKTNTTAESDMGSKAKSSSFEKLCDSLLGNDPNNKAPPSQDSSPTDSDRLEDLPASVDVENEYDYIKYARVQKGDSYVGMRLAYSTSSDSLKAKRNWNGNTVEDMDEEYLGSSQENSPEKHSKIRQAKLADPLHMSKVNEETLTEIPLNGSDHTGDDKTFSLSPEATECDSAEVESILSEEGKSSTSGMPMVEDGLSSSQGSDAEDSAMPDANQLPQPSPAEILKRKFIAEIEQGLGENGAQDDPQSMSVTDNSSSQRSTPSHLSAGSGHDRSTPSQGSVGSSHDTSSKNRNSEVDMAIQDIKSAIQRSKTAQQRAAPNSDGGDQDPIWVRRDSYVRKLGRHDNGSEYSQRPPEPDSDEDYLRQDPEQEYVADGDHVLTYPYSRTDDKAFPPSKEYDTDEETDELLDKQYIQAGQVDIPELTEPPVNRTAQSGETQGKPRQNRAREGEKESLSLRDPESNQTVLIEGVLFRAKYLGSTQLISEGQPSKGLRMMQAQEAVGRIKAPEGETQPSTEVDLFVSIEKIMVLNTDLQEIMMDHALRTISYIADIGDILVIMARRGPVMSPGKDGIQRPKRQTKICCHVFESDEAQLIAQSIGQAFQVAYMEFLKANGIDDPSMLKEIDYQEVLNQQEIFGEELFLFSNKEMQKEVIVPKLKNEPLGVVIVESGWGSMVPTVVLANMSPSGAAARGGQLNIGDQIMSINGVSLVGLPLSSCQNYIKAAKNQTVVKLNVVSCAPVVEVLIKRPDVKYQLGFSVQNGVICSLLRGGIAERGGVRVGHRIIEINGESVVAVPHEKIVKMLATSVGEIHMKTMPTSIFRLLTGQDVPHYI